MGFRAVDLSTVGFDFACELQSRYCLVTASSHGETNMLTAAWGQVGHLWQRYVATVYIRPSRYTRELMDESGRFTICFIDGHSQDLIYLGRHSGRDEDKLSHTSLELVDFEGDPIYDQAELALVCKTVYRQPIDMGCFLDEQIIQEHYNNRETSIEYIGQIEKVLVPR